MKRVVKVLVLDDDPRAPASTKKVDLDAVAAPRGKRAKAAPQMITLCEGGAEPELLDEEAFKRVLSEMNHKSEEPSGWDEGEPLFGEELRRLNVLMPHYPTNSSYGRLSGL